MRDRGLLWVVVEVQAGIPVQAAVFRQRAEAEEVERSIRARLSLDEDETAVFAARAAGDERAARLIERMTDRLGALIGAAVQLLDPEVVVIGGGVANAGETLLEPLRVAVRRYALESHARHLRVVPAALGGRAGTVGAGLAAWDLARGPAALD